jgi:hypothetical protein
VLLIATRRKSWFRPLLPLLVREPRVFFGAAVDCNATNLTVPQSNYAAIWALGVENNPCIDIYVDGPPLGSIACWPTANARGSTRRRVGSHLSCFQSSVVRQLH